MVAAIRDPSDRLEPGEHCRISEEQWFARLERSEVLHQWGSAFLVDEGEPGPVRAYWRDDSPARRHTAWRFDAATSERVRAAVVRIEAAAAAVADLIAAAAERGSSDLDQHAAEQRASEAYTTLAEDLYRDLLRLGPPGPPPGGAS